MAKKVLILSGSPRKGGASDSLCDAFLKGAEESGHQVEKVFIREKKIGYCNACFYCAQNGGVCALKDDMADILTKMKEADVIVMSSPVYFYSIDAQMKTLIDRTFAQWTQLKNKELYFIMTSADDTATVMDGTLACFRGFEMCLDGAKERGIIYGKAMHDAAAEKGQKYVAEAYEMGKNV